MIRLFGALLTTGLLLASPALAQGIDLPAKSPLARVMQHVGFNEITVEYSSPGVKGRTIWGDLVAYDKLWRTGANAATRLTLSHDAEIGGQKVPAGTYALLTIPGKGKWTVILNKNAAIRGTGGYDKAQDAARFEVKPEKANARERMTFVFSDTTDHVTHLDLEWAGLRVRLPIKVGTAAEVDTRLKRGTENAWRPHYDAARYLLERRDNAKEALPLVKESIRVKSTWANHWLLARVLEKMGDKAEAKKAAQTALKIGGSGGAWDFYRPQIEAAIKRL